METKLKTGRWDEESDTARLEDLAKLHGLTFKHVGSTYIFDDFNAHGVRQALGFAEGFDRARNPEARMSSAEETP
jgi:hypothetical protein